MRFTPLFALIVGTILIGQADAAKDHVNVPLAAVGTSSVSGHVELMQLPQGGTRIIVHAKGLTPGATYLSLYYENHTCEVEPYDPEDVIGHYKANGGGNATVSADVEDAIDDINSVSVRVDPDFTLLACADTHAGE